MDEHKCPFLRLSCATYGSLRGPKAAGPVPIFEDLANFETAFRAFHGEHGMLPLPHAELVLRGPLLPFMRPGAAAAPSSAVPAVLTAGAALSAAASDVAPAEAEAAPFSARAATAAAPADAPAAPGPARSCAAEAAAPGAAPSFASRLAALPLATASLSFFPFPAASGGDPRGRRGQQPPRAPSQPPTPHGHTPPPPPPAPAASVASAAVEAGFMAGATALTGPQAEEASRCPLAKWPKVQKSIGRMLGMGGGGPGPVHAMQLQCPAPIVALRKALAATPQVRALRPRPVPAKVAAVAAASLLCNIPLGMWRQHTKKFSPEWFVAVHAALPFIISLRKAVVMPRYAIAFTIGSAVLGQLLGARLEKDRMAAAGGGAGRRQGALRAVGLHGEAEAESGAAVEGLAGARALPARRARRCGAAAGGAWARAHAGGAVACA